MRSKNTVFNSLIIGAAVLLLGALLGFGQEVAPQKIVPQEIGFKDVNFRQLDQSVCQTCHAEPLVEVHHKTKEAHAGNCWLCHEVSREKGNVGVSRTKDCMHCHRRSLHHKTKKAKAKDCLSCHKTPGINTYSLEVPDYKPSKVTPTVDDCKTCHKPGKFGEGHILSIEHTHHRINLEGCAICHVEDDKRSRDIRICGRCHSGKALHQVLPHVQEENCVKCHAVNKEATENHDHEQEAADHQHDKEEPKDNKE